MPNAEIKSYAHDWKRLFLELLVVFLGVTAGFLLNSWQLERQDEDIANKYMDGFLHDVNANIVGFEEAIAEDSLWLIYTTPSLRSIQNGSVSVDSANVVLKQIVSISSLEFQTSTYEDITNSGKLNIISDYDLKKQIVDYHVTILGVGFIDDYFYDFFNDFSMPFIFSNFSVLNGRLAVPEIRNSIEFANVIAGYYSMVQQRQSAYQKLLDESHALKSYLKDPT